MRRPDLKSTLQYLFVAATCCFLHTVSPTNAADVPVGYAVKGVAVIDVESGRLHEGQTVLVRGQTIERIASSDRLAPPAEYHTVDGEGLYLIPGLFNAHVHYVSPETFGPLMIAHGVTAARDTGSETSSVLALVAQSEQPAAIQPNLIVTGAIVDGKPPVWPFSEACDTPDDARRAVRKLAAAGVNQIKVYSRLKPEVFRAAVEQAHAEGLKVTGHVPDAVTLDEAIDAGQDCVEHLTGFDKALSRLAGRPAPSGEQVFIDAGPWAAMPQIDRGQLRSYLRRIAAKQMHQCPTLTVMRGVIMAANRSEAEKDERLAYVPVALRSFWSTPVYEQMGRAVAEAFPHMRTMVGELHRAGVPVMVGTDLGNPYVFAGASVHEEMRLFAEAGIPPIDVLRAATIVPAKFCGVDHQLGTIAEGKVASMVLLRANPLEDIANVSQISGVFLRGRYLDRTRLDELLNAVKQSVTGTVAEAEAVDVTLPGRVLHRGRYVIKFGQFDAGTEEFVITSDDAGYHIRSHNRSQGGPLPPTLLTYHTDQDFRLIRAEYRILTVTPQTAVYQLDGDVLRVTAEQDGQSIGAQEVDLSDAALFSGPFYALEFITHRALPLDAGQTKEVTIAGFGFANPGWRVMLSEQTIAREQDTTIHVEGRGDVPVRLYVNRFTLQGAEFVAKSWVDESGLMLKVVMTMPFGTITATLAEW